LDVFLCADSQPEPQPAPQPTAFVRDLHPGDTVNGWRIGLHGYPVKRSFGSAFDASPFFVALCFLSGFPTGDPSGCVWRGAQRPFRTQRLPPRFAQVAKWVNVALENNQRVADAAVAAEKAAIKRLASQRRSLSRRVKVEGEGESDPEAKQTEEEDGEAELDLPEFVIGLPEPDGVTVVHVSATECAAMALGHMFHVTRRVYVTPEQEGFWTRAETPTRRTSKVPRWTGRRIRDELGADFDEDRPFLIVGDGACGDDRRVDADDVFDDEDMLALVCFQTSPAQEVKAGESDPTALHEVDVAFRWKLSADGTVVVPEVQQWRLGFVVAMVENARDENELFGRLNDLDLRAVSYRRPDDFIPGEVPQLLLEPEHPPGLAWRCCACGTNNGGAWLECRKCQHRYCVVKLAKDHHDWCSHHLRHRRESSDTAVPVRLFGATKADFKTVREYAAWRASRSTSASHS